MTSMFEKAKDYAVNKIAEIEKPTIKLSDIDVGPVDRHSATLEFEVVSYNPYSHDLPLFEIQFAVLSHGKELASGTIPDPGDLKAKKDTNFRIPIKVPYNILMNIVNDVKSDWDVDYLLRVGLVMQLPIIGKVTIPFDKEGEFKLPTVSDIAGSIF